MSALDMRDISITSKLYRGIVLTTNKQIGIIPTIYIIIQNYTVYSIQA